MEFWYARPHTGPRRPRRSGKPERRHARHPQARRRCAARSPSRTSTSCRSSRCSPHRFNTVPAASRGSSWSGSERMPMELLDRTAPQPTVIPNVRTREGIRLRWFDEHPSNLIGAGQAGRHARISRRPCWRTGTRAPPSSCARRGKTSRGDGRTVVLRSLHPGSLRSGGQLGGADAGAAGRPLSWQSLRPAAGRRRALCALRRAAQRDRRRSRSANSSMRSFPNSSGIRPMPSATRWPIRASGPAATRG